MFIVALGKGSALRRGNVFERIGGLVRSSEQSSCFKYKGEMKIPVSKIHL